MPSPPPALLSADTVWRHGRLAMQGLATAVIALVLGVAWYAPELSPFVPLGLLALVVGWWLFQHPKANIAVLLVASVATLDYTPGIQPAEALYGVYYLTFMAHWYGGRLLRGERFVRTRTDWAVALLAVAGLAAGVALGFLFGGVAGEIRGEATGFLMIATYFPVKELCREERYGPEILLTILFGIGLVVVARYVLNFRAIIMSATEMWQIADARPGINDIQLLVAGLTALTLLVHLRGWKKQLGLLVLLSLFVGGLIITKSRGYWIDFALGTLVLFVLINARTRWRLVVLIGGGLAVTIGFAFVFFAPVADLIISGTARRFSTLATAATQDRSLVNRFIENEAIWEGIFRNPFLGHGFGTRIAFYDINLYGTKVTSFMHNGYLALWFKLGLGGLALMLVAWGGAAWQGLRAFRQRHAPLLHRLCALSAAVILVALTPSVSTSSPFFLMDQMFTFTLQLGIAAGIYQRYAAPEPGGEMEGGVAQGR